VVTSRLEFMRSGRIELLLSNSGGLKPLPSAKIRGFRTNLHLSRDFWAPPSGLGLRVPSFILPKDQLYVPPYQIPFRALLVKGSGNLLAAGRCFSADQLALSSARVTTTCAMLGQAAGIAAAMACRGSVSLRALDLADIRNEVESKGGILAT
jgi:hypothetical protein